MNIRTYSYACLDVGFLGTEFFPQWFSHLNKVNGQNDTRSFKARNIYVYTKSVKFIFKKKSD